MHAFVFDTQRQRWLYVVADQIIFILESASEQDIQFWRTTASRMTRI